MALGDTIAGSFWEFAIFAFSIAATVSTAMIPGIWHAPKNSIANFAYGAPACVESLLHATQIDVRDSEELLKPGFHEPIYASPKKYDSFLYDFGANIPLSRLECTTAAAASAAAGCLVEAQSAGFRYDLTAAAGNADCADANNIHVYGEPVEDWGNGAISVDDDVGGTLGDNCKDRYPKPFVDARKAEERIVSFFTTSTTAPPSGRSTVTTTTTTTTRPEEERVIGPQQANVVLNMFYNQSVSPYLNGEKDENRCEEILGKLRGDVNNTERDWNLFDDVGNLGEVMICNIVYGWALGEYCASGLDVSNEPYFGATTIFDSTDPKLIALDTALGTAQGTDGDDARDQCENVTRTTCGAADNFIGGDAAVTARDTAADNAGIGNAGAPPFMYDTSGTDAQDTAALTALVERIKTNPCFMKTGYGRSPINKGRMFGSFVVASGATENGPVIPGTGQSPSVGTGFFKNHKGLPLVDGMQPNHFVDLGLTDGITNQLLHDQYDQDEDFQTVSIGGNPTSTFTRYNVRQSAQGNAAGGENTDYNDDHGTTAEFARVQVPITQVDSRYIYERFVYDVLVLGQMADAVGREQDFYNMLPDTCFSQGAGGSSRLTTRIVWTVLMVLLIAFTFVSVLHVRELGFNDKDTKKCWNMIFFSEVVQTKIIFILSLIVGILGFTISMGANPDGPYATDGAKSGLQQWADVLASSVAGSYNADDGNGNHGTARFLVDLANGNYHAAYGLDENQQYMAYIASIMCAMITVLGVIMILFKKTKEGEAVLSKGKLIGDWA